MLRLFGIERLFLYVGYAALWSSCGSLLQAEDGAGVDAIIATGRKNNQVQVHLDVLTNRIGPRLTGSRGLQTACEWAREHFESMGLTNCHLDEWGEVPVGFDRGPAYGTMVAPTTMHLNFATNSWTAGTKGNVTGLALMAPRTLEELNAQRDKLEGAYVFMPRNQRMGGGFRRGASSTTQRPTGRPPTVEQPVALGESPAASNNSPGAESSSRGSLASDTSVREELSKIKVAGYVYSTLDELILTAGNFQIDWKKLPETPSIQLQRSQWDEISKRIQDGEEVKLSFDIRNYFRKGPVPLYNVIADIPGTEWPDEYVVVGGHIDSWDGATGATDNAAGCATTIEAARILIESGVKPKRTIRFMLWSGEEQGLLGSMGYVKKHPDLMPKISAVLVHDGGTNYVAGIGGSSSMLDAFHQVFAAAKTLDEKAPFEVRKVDQILPRGGSDHVSFIQAGVPGFFWDQRGRATYRNTHHTQYDTYDTIVPEYQEHSSIVIAIGAFGIANLDSLLPRDAVRRGR